MTLLRRQVLLGAALLLVLVPLFAFAATFKAGDQITLPASETANEDLYMAGGNVTSVGAIRGDLIVAGGNVLISSAVSADVNAAGGTVTVLGNVGDDVRALGGTIVIQGSVGGDVVAGGGQITLTGSEIGGDVAVGGGAVTIAVPIAGNLKAGAGDITIDSRIAGNVEIKADKVTLGENAIIEGNLTYTAGKPATIAEGAQVRGETTFEERKAGRGVSTAGVAAFFSLALLAKFLMSLVGALAIGYFFHRYSRELVATVAAQPFSEIGRGIIFFIVLPVVSVILLATVIGLPIGILGLLAFGAASVFAYLASPIVAGAYVHKWIWKPANYQVDWKTILLGTFVYFVLGLIPFLGWIATFAIFLATLGAALKIKWSVVKDWR